MMAHTLSMVSLQAVDICFQGPGMNVYTTPEAHHLIGSAGKVSLRNVTHIGQESGLILKVTLGTRACFEINCIPNSYAEG